MELCYTQYHAGGYVGNSLVFWADNDRGYVTDLNRAKVFDREDMEALLAQDQGKKYTAWPCYHLDEVATRQVDSQRVNNDLSMRGERTVKEG